MSLSLPKKTRLVASLLAKKRRRLVLAESCTGGLLASLFTEIPGVSNVFCGSEVVYREASKRAWLGVRANTLGKRSAVSRETVEEMVKGVLKRTPEADLAGAITGYLGPAGKHVGRVYLSVFARGDRAPTTLKLEIGKVRGTPIEARLARREIAAGKLVETLLAVLRRS